MTYVKVNLQSNDVITKDALDHYEQGIADAAVASDVTAALALKAPINNPTFTGTIGGITKTMVGLGNVDNTSDANKPISTSVQAALTALAPRESPAFTGTPTINGVPIGSGGGGSSGGNGYTTQQIDALLAAKAPLQSPTFTGNVNGITTSMLPDFQTAVNNAVVAALVALGVSAEPDAARFTDNNDGTFDVEGTAVEDNGDVFTANSTAVVDNNDGTYTASSTTGGTATPTTPVTPVIIADNDSYDITPDIVTLTTN